MSSIMPTVVEVTFTYGSALTKNNKCFFNMELKCDTFERGVQHPSGMFRARLIVCSNVVAQLDNRGLVIQLLWRPSKS